jgi:hypothetical protein
MQFDSGTNSQMKARKVVNTAGQAFVAAQFWY